MIVNKAELNSLSKLCFDNPYQILLTLANRNINQKILKIIIEKYMRITEANTSIIELLRQLYKPPAKKKKVFKQQANKLKATCNKFIKKVCRGRVFEDKPHTLIITSIK